MFTAQLTLFKTCQRCHVEKSLSEFNKDKRYADGLQPWCRSCYREYRNAWEQEHKAERAPYFKRWHQENIERRHIATRARCRERWHNDPEYRKRKNKQGAIKMQRRRMSIQSSGTDYTVDEWTNLCAHYDYRCLACGEQKPLTADHIVPLSRGGSNSIDNIQPLCHRCNSIKHTKVIDYRK